MIIILFGLLILTKDALTLSYNPKDLKFIHHITDVRNLHQVKRWRGGACLGWEERKARGWDRYRCLNGSLQQKSAPGWSQCSSHNPHTYTDTHSCKLIHHTHTLAHLRRKSAEILQRRGQIELFMHTVYHMWLYFTWICIKCMMCINAGAYLMFTSNAYVSNDIDYCLYSLILMRMDIFRIDSVMIRFVWGENKQRPQSDLQDGLSCIFR